jgi:aldehyde dehydrogenase (NAD+)
MTASPIAAATVNFNPETRLYIDGRLRDSSTGKTADNINPANEELLGVATDASAEDMDEAIAAARKAFDTTDWSTNHDFRQHCLEQLHAALQVEKEEMRAELIAEVGATVGMTYIAQ